MRSHSLPLELSSFRKRSAKLVQGTNSNFIGMPLLAVKSFDSSTRALAGSQAAQHSVNGFESACAAGAGQSSAAIASGRARATSGCMIDLLRKRLRFIAVMFTKLIFTKHCQH